MIVLVCHAPAELQQIVSEFAVFVGKYRRIGGDVGEEIRSLAIIAKIGFVPKCGGEKLSAAVEKNLIGVAQSPLEKSAPSKFVDEVMGPQLNVRLDKIGGGAGIAVGAA